MLADIGALGDQTGRNIDMKNVKSKYKQIENKSVSVKFEHKTSRPAVAAQAKFTKIFPT